MCDTEEQVDYDELNDDDVVAVSPDQETGGEIVDSNKKSTKRDEYVNGLSTCVLFLSKFPSTVTKQEIKELCEKYGKTSDISLKDTFAFVDFENAEEAAIAKKAMHGQSLLGTNYLICDFKKQPQNSSRRNDSRRVGGGGMNGGDSDLRRGRGDDTRDRDRNRFSNSNNNRGSRRHSRSRSRSRSPALRRMNERSGNTNNRAANDNSDRNYGSNVTRDGHDGRNKERERDRGGSSSSSSYNNNSNGNSRDRDRVRDRGARSPPRQDRAPVNLRDELKRLQQEQQQREREQLSQRPSQRSSTEDRVRDRDRDSRERDRNSFPSDNNRDNGRGSSSRSRDQNYGHGNNYYDNYAPQQQQPYSSNNHDYNDGYQRSNYSRR